MRSLLLPFVILALALLGSTRSYAEGGKTFAQFAYKLINGDCPKSEPIKESSAADCDPNKEALTKDLGKISEVALINGLANERADALQCSADQITELLKDPAAQEKVSADALAKIKSMAAAQKKMDELRPQILGLGAPSTNRFGKTVSEMEGSDGKPLPGSILDQYQQALRTFNAVRSSIQFNELTAHSEEIEKTILQVVAGEFDAKMEARFKKRYQEILRSTKAAATSEALPLRNKEGKVFEHAVRESLVQDTDLFESYRQRQGETESIPKSLLCRVDAKYGKGAQYRDRTTAAASLVGGLGAVGATRLGTAAIRSLTGAAAKGSMSLRSASILRWGAFGAGESANLGFSIADTARECGSAATLSGNKSGGHSCEKNVLKSIEANQCYLSVALTAIGSGAGVLAGTEALLGKYAKRVPQGASRGEPNPSAIQNEIKAKSASSASDSYSPLLPPSSKIDSDFVYSSEQGVFDELINRGISVKKAKGLEGKTVLKRLEENGEVTVSPGKDGTKHYGDIYEVAGLPRSSAKPNPRGNAFEHPEMSSYLEKMRARGYRLVIDTSIDHANMGAYFGGHQKVIALPPNATWQTFIHEYEHLEFDEVIRPVFNTLVGHRTTRTGDLNSLSPEVLQAVGPTRLKKMQNLINRGVTDDLAINETLAVDAEIRALGWKRFLPNSETNEVQAYAIRHQIQSLTNTKFRTLRENVLLNELKIKHDQLEERKNLVRKVELKMPAAINAAKQGALGAGAAGSASAAGIVGPDALTEKTAEYRQIFYDKVGNVLGIRRDGKLDVFTNDLQLRKSD